MLQLRVYGASPAMVDVAARLRAMAISPDTLPITAAATACATPLTQRSLAWRGGDAVSAGERPQV